MCDQQISKYFIEIYKRLKEYQIYLTKIVIIVTRGITKKPQSVTLSTFHYMELVSTIDYYCQ